MSSESPSMAARPGLLLSTSPPNPLVLVTVNCHLYRTLGAGAEAKRREEEGEGLSSNGVAFPCNLWLQSNEA